MRKQRKAWTYPPSARSCSKLPGLNELTLDAAHKTKPRQTQSGGVISIGVPDNVGREAPPSLGGLFIN